MDSAHVTDPTRPPEHLLGAPTSISFVAATSAEAMVKVQHVTAYPTGFEFEVLALYRGGWGTPSDPSLWDPMHGLAGVRGGPGQPARELSDEHLLLRLEGDNGYSVDNGVWPRNQQLGQTPPSPMLVPFEGGATEGRVRACYWVTPLPPPGRLALVCMWPKYKVPLTRHPIELNVILEASRHAVEAWPGDTR
jgi:hypothetical protein